jgi:hypothetical protein
MMKTANLNLIFPTEGEMQTLTRIRLTGLALFLVLFNFTGLSAQTDARFGTVGREGAERLNLKLYREYQRQNDDPVAPGKQKHFVVGQLTNRSDTLGVDWEWYILDLLEQPNSLLLQHFLNLALALIKNDAVPVVRDAWAANRDDLAAAWKQTVDGTSKTWSKKVFGVTIYSYTVRLSDTKVDLPVALPEIQLTVAADGEHINLQVDLDVVWSTYAVGSRKTIHATPTFNTKLTLLGTIEFGKDGEGRYLAIKEIHGKSVTDAQGDIKFNVNILGIGTVSFTWSKLDILIQSQIDRAIESGAGKIMDIDNDKDGHPDLAQHFYFEPFLSKTFFGGKPLPRQQNIIDRVFARERKWIYEQIQENNQRGAYWEIGNEPNWFPLMRPEQYAAIYARYCEQIKKYDATAKCLIGGLFLKEAIDNPREIIAAGIPFFFGSFRDELATFISAALFQTSTTAWYEAFRAALPPGVKVDIGNFHLYPMRASDTAFQLANVQAAIEKLAASFKASGVTEMWATEFGNIDWRRTEPEAAQLCWELSKYFKTNAVGIQRWYWSRSIGYDKRFDAVGLRPISALLADDGKTLTRLGQMYQLAANSQSTAVDEFSPPVAALPKTLMLAPSYPNPFAITRNAATRIAYALPQASEMSLRIYDVLGRLTRQIVAGQQAAGAYEILWDGRNETGGTVTSGIYFAVLQAGAQRLTQKIVVTR